MMYDASLKQNPKTRLIALFYSGVESRDAFGERKPHVQYRSVPIESARGLD
jgi:hypothetical protein